MSQALYWSTIPKTTAVKPQCITLRDALVDFHGPARRRLTSDDIPFLEGVVAAHVEGAIEVIELIHKYGTIGVLRA